MPPAPRNVVVRRKELISPNLVRMTLGGESLADFPEGYESGYVKLMFPRCEEKPIVRSYTVRSFRAEAREIDLEMVVHGDTGPAASWANRARQGDEITIGGPGACQRVNTQADWFLLAGDMSALPAIRVNLESLPDDAIGHLVLEVITEEDRIELDRPRGVEVHWVVNPDPELPNTILEDTVMALPWREGQPSVWVAGEFSASRALRQYFRKERELSKEFMYVSCYWKIGDTDEGMKAAKRADPEPW